MNEHPSDLLTQPHFTVRSREGATARQSLPGVLAGICRGEVETFPALQAHQAHAWHSFLVQAAAMALHGAGRVQPPSEEAEWRDLLADLGPEPGTWQLVNPDLGAPAFFQSPVPEGSLQGFKNTLEQPDELDLLVLAKAHDLKPRRFRAARPEHWAYALVSLQTMEGFGGRTKYGIVRMNGGYGSRACITFVPPGGLAERFRRDLQCLASDRANLGRQHGYRSAGGVRLLWVVPWDGAEQLDASDLDPHFIETCRRVRLLEENGLLLARETGSLAARLRDDPPRLGDTGDPWGTVQIGEEGIKALSVPSDGFPYGRMQGLLLSANWRHGATGRLRQADPEGMTFVASAVARGQGQTNGIHERRVRVPPPLRRSLLDPDERDQIGRLSEHRVERVAVLTRRVLHPALCRLLQADPDKLDLRDDRTKPWLDALGRDVDDAFFPRLVEDLDLDEMEREGRWNAFLAALARAHFEEAVATAPIPVARRYRAVARAEGQLMGALRKQGFSEAPAEPERSQEGG